MRLTPSEVAQYQRHLSLAGFGVEAQEKLKRSRVLVIGAGGLGCPALLYLAAAGVGKIAILDPDRVDVSNLQRQVLYTAQDAGELKVAAAQRRLRALNPHIEVVGVPERFSRANALARVREADVVIDGSDNFETRYLVNDACVMADRPFVYGAIQGFDGQASVFNFRGGPTYRCLFPEPPDPASVPNCADAGVLGVLPGLIGTIQATEAVKILTGIGEPLSGKVWLWSALTMSVQILKLSADPQNRLIRELPPEGYGAVCAVASSTAVPEIDAGELKSILASESASDWQLLDVREPWERAQAAIEPSRLIPLGKLEGGGAADELADFDPKKRTLVYCATGRRSLRGVVALRERYGFTCAVSLRGGIKAWLNSGIPVA